MWHYHRPPKTPLRAHTSGRSKTMTWPAMPPSLLKVCSAFKSQRKLIFQKTAPEAPICQKSLAGPDLPQHMVPFTLLTPQTWDLGSTLQIAVAAARPGPSVTSVRPAKREDGPETRAACSVCAHAAWAASEGSRSVAQRNSSLTEGESVKEMALGLCFKS